MSSRTVSTMTVILTVADAKAASEFYERAFGFVDE